MSELAMQTEKEEIAYLNSLCEDEKEVLSSCCGYEPMGELHYDNESKEVEMVGLCSKCKDHADFEEV
jgi:CobQ-like glutamine amidotransferase family enzyme